MTNKQVFTLLILDLVLVLVLKHVAITGLIDISVYRGLAWALDFGTIALMLANGGWPIAAKSKLSPGRSALFAFGGIIIALLATNVWVAYLRTQAVDSPLTPTDLGAVSPEKALTWFSIVVSVVIAPIREELLYRHGMQRILGQYLSVPFAIAIPALIFAASHVGNLPLMSLPPIFLGGLLLGVIYRVAGLWWAIFAHCIVNAQPLISALNLFDSTPIFAIYALFAAAGVWIFISTSILILKGKKA